MVKINWKGKRIVEKANKRVNRKNNNRLKKLKIKKEREKKRKTLQNCKGPMQRQRFMTTRARKKYPKVSTEQVKK